MSKLYQIWEYSDKRSNLSRLYIFLYIYSIYNQGFPIYLCNKKMIMSKLVNSLKMNDFHFCQRHENRSYIKWIFVSLNIFSCKHNNCIKSLCKCRWNIQPKHRSHYYFKVGECNWITGNTAFTEHTIQCWN